MTVGYPLSPVQRHLHRVAGDRLDRHVTWLEFTTDADPAQVRAAVARLAARHEILASAFVAVDPAVPPLQVVEQPVTVLDAADRTDVRVTAPDVRLVAEPGPEGWTMALGWSALAVDLGCLPRVAAELEVALGDGLDDAAAPYSMVAQWLTDFPGSAEAVAGTAFWQRDQGGEPPAGRSEPPADDRPCAVRVPLDDATVGGLHKLADHWQVGVDRIVLAVWAQLANRADGESPTRLECYTHGRSDPELDEFLGPLGRYLPLWFADLADGPARAAVRSADRAVTEAELHAESWVPPDSRRHRYGFDAVHVPAGAPGAGSRVTVTGAHTHSEEFLSKLSCVQAGDGLQLTLTGLGAPRQERLRDRLVHALTVLVEQGGDAPLGAVVGLPDVEAAEL
ncbi:MAG: hypothetical protein WCA46_21925, partial [Actinocatenispora sp.]